MSENRISAALLAVVLLPTMLANSQILHLAEPSNSDSFSHGTCAIFAQNATNAALVVDSVQQVQTGKGDVSANAHACKMSLPHPNVVMVVTGLLEAKTGMFGHWNSKTRGEDVLAHLPLNPDDDQVDKALREWSSDLVTYVTKDPSFRKEDKEVGELFVAYRVGDKIHIAKERVNVRNKKAQRDDSDSYRFILHNTGSALYYSGSCRDYISVSGHRGVELERADVSALDHLGRYAKSVSINTASDLTSAVVSIEELLTRYSEKYRDDKVPAVGPPFQKAVLTPDGTWKTYFVEPCPVSETPHK